jgi:[Skp1-protein]-hydroxyproline N-acetylglucosaminyltransferase
MEGIFTTSRMSYTFIAVVGLFLVLHTIISLSLVISLTSLATTKDVIFEKRVKDIRNIFLSRLKQDPPQDKPAPQEYEGMRSSSTAKLFRLHEINDIVTLQNTFPVHVGYDSEEIDHPGILFSNKTEIQDIIKEHHLPTKLKVPKLWRPQAYGPAGVRAFLGDHGKRLPTPEEADQIGSFYEGHETIYVSIASYRDPECGPTVEDLYLRSKYPERIRVAIIDQRAEGDPFCSQPAVPCDQDSNQIICKYRHLIDVYEVPSHLSVGPVFARHLANRMYRGEHYAMQVDAHVRFIQDWDKDLIKQWKSAKNEMAVLTVYLSDLIGSIDPVTHQSRHKSIPIMCETGYEDKGKLRHLRHGEQPEGTPRIHGMPTLEPFWAAGFSFARGHFVVQVPYDQYQPIVFQGEEISIGLRGFTYGYDYYAPERSVVFHMYAVKENRAKRKQIKKFWENTNLYPGADVEGMKRLNGIIGMGDPEDEYSHLEEEDYGLGQIRDKEVFFGVFGIHTDTKTVEHNLCDFVGKPMQRMFLPFLRKDGMGIDYSKIDYRYVDLEEESEAESEEESGEENEAESGEESGEESKADE